jgi:hypothetical protein
MGFSLISYDALLDVLVEAGRSMMGVAAAVDVSARDETVSLAILRHDVDRLPGRAVTMARLEHHRGVRSSYYFRCNRQGAFPEAAVREVSALGHEVGYHYETLSACRGNMAAACAAFAENLGRLRALAPVRSVVQHGAPLSPHDNQRLMSSVNLDALGVIDAAAAMNADHLVYFTDTGGRWNARGNDNLRDRVANATAVRVDPADSVAFLDFLRSHPGSVYLSAHPERWPSSRMGRLQADWTDGAVNLAKRVLASFRQDAP